MKTTRPTWLQAGLLSGVLLLSAAGAWADDHGREKGGHGDWAERHEQRMQERTDALRDALQLQATQQGAWDAFKAAMKPPTKPETKDRQAHREAFKDMNTLQRLDWMKTMKAKRDSQMDQRDQAIRSFYQQLDTSQQKTFDAQFWMRGDGHHDRGREERSHEHGEKPTR